MSKALETINKKTSEGFDWMVVLIDSISGSHISQSTKEPTKQKINALCQELKSIVHKIEGLVNEYGDICHEITSIEDEIGYEETQEHIIKGIQERLRRVAKELFGFDPQTSHQNLFVDYSANGIKKAALRLMIQTEILKEIRAGKR